MFKKNNKTENLFDKRINEQKRRHDEMLKKEVDNLNKIIQSEKYNIDTMISKSNLSNVYHDLIDTKDELNSEYQTKYNQTYHTIDIELRKMNKRIDNEARLINYKYNTKKEEILNKVMTRL